MSSCGRSTDVDSSPSGRRVLQVGDATAVPCVSAATSRNFKRGRCESRAVFFTFIVSSLTFDTGASLASGPFQMLFGSTMKMATRPAHVTLPGLMGNRISAPVRYV